MVGVGQLGALALHHGSRLPERLLCVSQPLRQPLDVLRQLCVGQRQLLCPLRRGGHGPPASKGPRRSFRRAAVYNAPDFAPYVLDTAVRDHLFSGSALWTAATQGQRRGPSTPSAPSWGHVRVYLRHPPQPLGVLGPVHLPRTLHTHLPPLRPSLRLQLRDPPRERARLLLRCGRPPLLRLPLRLGLPAGRRVGGACGAEGDDETRSAGAFAAISSGRGGQGRGWCCGVHAARTNKCHNIRRGMRC